MIGVLDTATDRTGLLGLQAFAQLFDAFAARQALAFEQLQGHLQGLLGLFVGCADLQPLGGQLLAPGQ